MNRLPFLAATAVGLSIAMPAFAQDVGETSTTAGVRQAF